MSTQPTDAVATQTNRHNLSAVERQRVQLDRLLKDPTKAVYIPLAPKEKTIRPAREMMKNVQGSSAGAGSGEFHVYKASRRREYERLALLEEESRRETDEAEFKKKREEIEAVAEAKTAKNRAKRQKKKEKARTATMKESAEGSSSAHGEGGHVPLKKRRLVNGRELVFKKQGENEEEASAEEEKEEEIAGVEEAQVTIQTLIPVAPPKMTIHEDN
ncbi:hypothetical protein D9757_000642 [Collybiopsis confluens]|uniref:DUF1168-domain-containing protein n=1 Tax=Collybiopsis confluens TaxID=2823264 RepID=A0A8H5I1I4_9AGAR|nr:hypothetical protein D9757_000642 [Collybiopsis confluens]